MTKLIVPLVVMAVIVTAVAALGAPASDPISALIGAAFDRPSPVVAQEARMRRRHHPHRARPPRRAPAPAIIAADPADANATALLIEPRVEIVRVRVNHPDREAVPLYWPGMLREIAATSRQIEMRVPETPASPSHVPAIIWMLLTIIAIELVLLAIRRLRRDPLRQAARNTVDDDAISAAEETLQWMTDKRQEAADRLRTIGIPRALRVVARVFPRWTPKSFWAR